MQTFKKELHILREPIYMGSEVVVLFSGHWGIEVAVYVTRDRIIPLKKYVSVSVEDDVLFINIDYEDYITDIYFRVARPSIRTSVENWYEQK